MLGEIIDHYHICPICQQWHICNGEACENQVEQDCYECMKKDIEQNVINK